MPSRRAAVVPAGLRRRLGPAPHAGVEAAGAGLLLVLGRVRGKTAEVRRRIVSRFIHTARPKSFLASTVKFILSKRGFLTTTQLSHVHVLLPFVRT